METARVRDMGVSPMRNAKETRCCHTGETPVARGRRRLSVGEKAPTTRYVVGLGNPGRGYAKTRHNVGFMVLKELRKRWDFGTARRKFHSRVWTGRIGAAAVTLLAPQTYMNRSGLAVAEATSFTKAPPEAVLVVLDDLALPAGKLRARATGSAGGHKGLADVIRALGGADVPRLRIGIGRPPDEMDAVDYVLTKFRKDEEPVIAEAVARAADAVEEWVGEGIARVMDHYNGLIGNNSNQSTS